MQCRPQSQRFHLHLALPFALYHRNRAGDNERGVPHLPDIDTWLIAVPVAPDRSTIEAFHISGTPAPTGHSVPDQAPVYCASSSPEILTARNACERNLASNIAALWWLPETDTCNRFAVFDVETIKCHTKPFPPLPFGIVIEQEIQLPVVSRCEIA